MDSKYTWKTGIRSITIIALVIGDELRKARLAAGLSQEELAFRADVSHTPGGPFRGGKYSIYEAGTRVPFILSWPRRVKPGVTDALVDQVDLLASFAALTSQPVPAGDAADSCNVLAAFLGDSNTGRDSLVEHDGYAFIALRDGLWKFLPPDVRKQHKYASRGELYNLGDDPGEKHNLTPRESNRANQLSAELDLVKKTPTTNVSTPK